MEKSQLFVNLSNHFSDKWSALQVEAAELFGKIVDVPFPDIPPSANESSISDLAEEYVQKIQGIGEVSDITVHIMGEMNFTYALVKRLRSQGICCVASTTCRIVEERDGQKISTFRFVKFRRYE